MRCSSARTSTGSWLVCPLRRHAGSAANSESPRQAPSRRTSSHSVASGSGRSPESRPGYCPPPMLTLIDHVGVAVEDIDESLAIYRDALGMPLVHRETVAEQGVDAALLDVGDCHVELLQPLGPDTAVGKYLARRGPGLHHVAYRVENIEDTLQALSAAGMRLIDEQPRRGIRNSRVAFVHPGSTASVLTEIVQPAKEAH